MEAREINIHDEVEFSNGKEDWTGAADRASNCLRFVPDVEEEWVSDEERSCYNCRYRRWTTDSFVCMVS